MELLPDISDFADYPGGGAIRLGKKRLGKAVTSQNIWVTQEELCAGCYILGIPGQGKTSLLEQVIYQQIQEQIKSIIVLAVHSGFVRNIIARIEQEKIESRKIYLLDPTDYTSPFSFNLFACHNPQDILERQAVRDQVMQAFAKLWPDVEKGIYFKQILRLIVSTLIECPELTLAHTKSLLQNSSFRSQYIQRLKSIETKADWHEFEQWTPSQKERECRPFISRAQELLADEFIKYIICQKQGRIDFRSAIEDQEIILIHLPVLDPRYKTAARTIGTFLMAAIYGATFSFADLAEKDRPGFTLIVDEFQNFATSDYAVLFSQGRQYGVQQFLAHQYRAQLDEVGMGTTKDATLSAHTIVAFRPNPNDVSAIDEKFKGLTRRPRKESLYRNPCDRREFEEHPNLAVKNFHWTYVRPLQELTKAQKREGGGNAGYKLYLLNELLYSSEVNEAIDESRLQSFLEVEEKDRTEDAIKDLWVLENKISYDDYSNWHERYREDIENECKRTDSSLLELEKAVEDAEEESLIGIWVICAKWEQREFNKLEELKQKFAPTKAALQQQIAALTAQRKEVENSISENERSYLYSFKDGVDQFVEDLPGLWTHGPDQLEVKRYTFPEQVRLYMHYYRQMPWYWGRTKKAYEKKYQEGMRVYQKQEEVKKRVGEIDTLINEREKSIRNHEDVCKAIEQECSKNMKHEQKKMYDRVTELKERLTFMKNEQQKLKPLLLIKRELDKVRGIIYEFEEKITGIVESVIAQPIASERQELSASDIAALLEKLEPRHALVNIGARVYEMETVNLNRVYLAEKRLQEFYDGRIGQIRRQTRETYCRPREQVEREIYDLFSVEEELEEEPEELEEDEDKKQERKPKPGQRRKQEGQPGKEGKSELKPKQRGDDDDYMDRLAGLDDDA